MMTSTSTAPKSKSQFPLHISQYPFLCNRLMDQFYSCRRVDQSSNTTATMPRSYNIGNYPFYATSEPEPRDIIPQASPSRPNSMLYSNSPPAPHTTTPSYHASAVSALRSINARPPSPPSPSMGSTHFWPFNNRSPNSSFTRPSAGYFSSTYDGGYSNGYYTYDAGSSSMDRPLPPTRHPNRYNRPKSIELVTPMVGGR